MTQQRSVKVAVVQAASVLFDHDASVDKACRLIDEAASAGAELILFPEAFIPCYPRGFSFGMVVGSRSPQGRYLWQRYWENSVEIPGPATRAIGEAARRMGAVVAFGVIERDRDYGGGTLYCTLLLIGPDGEILGKHRKLKPTGAERLIWGEGDGSDLHVYDTDVGRVGGLICWENYMPLARTLLYAKGVELYLAPTADARDTWQATLRHIALEGRCFVLGCNQFVTKVMVPPDLPMRDELDDQPDVMCRGGSVIVSPLGEVVAGPLYDEEGILYAELDRDLIVRSKIDFDPVGHYARPDVLRLWVDEAQKPPVFNHSERIAPHHPGEPPSHEGDEQSGGWCMSVKIYTCGGSIDKGYSTQESAFVVVRPAVAAILEEAKVTVAYEVEPLMQEDSLDMTDEDRALVVQRVRADDHRHILITHGTDTMVDTARALAEVPAKTIVLTGAMQPAAFRASDAHFNVGAAFLAVQLLPPGVYISMNGQIFDPAQTRKNVDLNRFEAGRDQSNKA